jgi:tetratricopeptide (TPR) repeat protein
VLNIDPRYVDALYSKGLVFCKQGKHQEAITWHDKALAIHPTYLHTLNSEDLILLNPKDWKMIDHLVSIHESGFWFRIYSILI